MYDPAQRQAENGRLAEYLYQKSSYSDLLTPDVAASLTKLTRTYPSMSATVATGVALSGVDWDGSPWIKDLSQRDATTQDTGMLSKLRGVTRGVTGVFESLYQASPVGGGLRVATRMQQYDEGFVDAWRRSGGDWVSRSAREWAKGNPINWGNGWFPQSTDPLEQPGAAARIGQAVKEGKSYADALAETEIWSAGKYGTPITADYDRIAESTLLSKTVNGVSHYSPVSLGRIAAIQVFDPNTIPFNVASGLVDFGVRISPLDPVEVPIREYGLYRAARRNLVPQQAAENFRQIQRSYLERHLGIEDDYLGGGIFGETQPKGAVPSEIADGLDPATVRMLKEDPEVERLIRYDDIETQIRGAKAENYIGTDATSRQVFQPGATQYNPYAQAFDRLDEIAMEKYGKKYFDWLYEQYGDMAEAMWDNTLTHELIHADQWNAELVKRVIDDPGGGDVDILMRNGPWTATEGSEVRRLEYADQADELAAKAKQARAHIDLTKQDAADAVEELAQAERRYGPQREFMTREQRKAMNKELNRLEQRAAKADEAYTDAVRSEQALRFEQEELVRMLQASEWIEFDATYQAGLKLLAGESASKDARKLALREAGITSSWRPYLKPQLIEDYLTSARGRHTIQWLANNKDLAKQRKVINHGLPGRVQLQIAKADTEAEVIRALAPYLGKEIGQAPLASRAARMRRGWVERLPGDPGSMLKFNGGIVTKVRTSTHRLGANAVKLELDPYDLEQTLDHATAWMRTIRATDDEVNDILYKIIAESDKPVPRMDDIFNELTQMFARKFDERMRKKGKKLNLSEENYQRLLEDTMADWTEAVLDNKNYQIDAVGNQIDDVNRVFTDMYMESDKAIGASVPRYSAVLESQTSMTRISLPNAREVRKATSGLHEVTQTLAEKILASKAFKNEGAAYRTLEKMFPGGLQSSWGIRFLDGVHKVWRDMALLRVGWPMRVIPEEMVRQAAAGYGDMVVHPFSYLALMMRKSMANDVMGNDLDSILTLDKLGSGHFRALDLEYDAARQSWTVVHPGAKGYEAGLGSEFLQLHHDEISSHAAREGMEETIKWLKTSEGQKAARRVTEVGGRHLDLSTEAGQKLYVERALALQAQYTGGAWVRQTPDGKWVDMAGNEVRSWKDMSKAELHAHINARRAKAGKEPLTAKPTSYTKEHWIDAAIEETGIPNLSTTDQTYVVIRQGDDRLRELLGTGRLADGKQIYFPEMKLRSRHEWDIKDYQRALMGAFDEYGVALPQSVRVPRNALNKPTDAYNKTIDTLFEVLMAKPSAYLVRSPFFRQVYSEEMAKWYIFGDAELRRHIKTWAADEGITSMFNRHVREQTANIGMKKVPPANHARAGMARWDGTSHKGIGMEDLKRIDIISRQRGLQRTKDLFYDLAERHNVTDMTKYIFPFADAWFEVLSRWGKLLFASDAQSLRNWRRMQVGVMNARKSGFFSEDEYGREVFNWPGAGLMAPWFANTPGNTAMSATMGLDQLMFIDPNPRGLMMPGVGPIVQFPTSMVQPYLEHIPQVQEAINWFAFGDFESIEPQTGGDVLFSFVPSWMRQVGRAFLADENRLEFADEIGRWYEVLLMSGSDQYGDETQERSRKTLAAAREVGTHLSFLKILDRMLAPATPKYEAAVDASLEDEDPFWLTALALESEWVAAQQFFEDSDTARTYFVNRFGLDPLNLGSATYRVTEAPTTEGAYEFLRQNQGLYELTPGTMMAWIDVDESEDFFFPAYQRQVAEGQRVKVTPEQRAWAINEQKGWHAYNKIKELYDTNRAQIIANTEERSPQRSRQLEVIDDWKRRVKHEIFEDYYAWDNQQGRENVGLGGRPATTQLWDEMIQAGTPGTDVYEYTRNLDPAMSDFMVTFATNLDLVRQTWLYRGDMDGWLTSTTPEAGAIRQGFIDQINLALMKLNGPSLRRGKHVIDRYVMPAFDMFEVDEPLWINLSQPEQLIEPGWVDKVPAAGPGVGLMGEANDNQ